MICRSYAVTPGDAIEDILPTEQSYSVRIDGPNGFMRGLSGVATPEFNAVARAEGENLSLTLSNTSGETVEVLLKDVSYGDQLAPVTLAPGQSHTLTLSTKSGQQWYDLSVSAGETIHRFAGRVETGAWSVSDPAMA
ncbi:MAG: hypothetical protein RLZZ303_2371, partial [Candidatus Hydrogenedentota bacterium]